MEYRLAKARVAGSNPVSCFQRDRKKSHPSDVFLCISLRARDVAERPGDVRLRRPEWNADIRTVRARQGLNSGGKEDVVNAARRRLRAAQVKIFFMKGGHDYGRDSDEMFLV